MRCFIKRGQGPGNPIKPRLYSLNPHPRQNRGEMKMSHSISSGSRLISAHSSISRQSLSLEPAVISVLRSNYVCHRTNSPIPIRTFFITVLTPLIQGYFQYLCLTYALPHYHYFKSRPVYPLSQPLNSASNSIMIMNCRGSSHPVSRLETDSSKLHG